MKALYTLLLIFLATPVSLGQSQSSSPKPAGVEVEYFSWDALYKGSWEPDVIDASSNIPQSGRHLMHPAIGDDELTKPRQLFHTGYVATVMIRNSGLKRIRSIQWEYCFVDATTREVNRRFQFRSQQKISPGATATFWKKAGFMASEFEKYEGEQKVVINRVEYSDGTVWQP
jgi:hypothetical protein